MKMYWILISSKMERCRDYLFLEKSLCDYLMFCTYHDPLTFKLKLLDTTTLFYNISAH